jgi:hypothetical protein
MARSKRQNIFASVDLNQVIDNTKDFLARVVMFLLGSYLRKHFYLCILNPTNGALQYVIS